MPGIDLSVIPIAEVETRLKTDLKRGLGDAEASRRLKADGLNALKKRKKKSFIARFISQLADFMVIILIVSAALSFFVSYRYGETDYTDPAVILAIVLLNSLIGVIQEQKAEKALDALAGLRAPRSNVIRSGKKKKIPSDSIVVGDLVYLNSGDLVPADGRIVECEGFSADESALTGESAAVYKIPGRDSAMAGTAILSGHGSLIVCATGMKTKMGEIAQMISESDSPQTPLQKRLAGIGKALGIAAIVICAVVFLLGLYRGLPSGEIFLTSVSLAVAAIPEGLPAIVTVMLALGVKRMAAKNTVIRNLPAVEVLGSTTVICSDKTGTLTQNKMEVAEVYGREREVYSLAVLCTNESDPTERAIRSGAGDIGIYIGALEKDYPRIAEYPFSSERKKMTTVHKSPTGYRVITKGAPDVIFPQCSNIGAVRRKSRALAQSALRVIAVAYADLKAPPKAELLPLRFAGLIALRDPPRPEVYTACAECMTAGIKPVMITGDHSDTARAIASELGIFRRGDTVLTGAELDSTDDSVLSQTLESCSVYARVTPAHKLRIVRAWQAKGAVVAMTGDGVNDAPALKAADIGCAMGSGTDVAREASDMVLGDDNFATVVEAVREGRAIYANIKRAIHFLLSSNIGEILTIFLSLAFGWAAPLAAIQLLWINLVTDSLPAIALGTEKPEKDIMRKPPVSGRHIFSGGLVFRIVIEGIMIGSLALLAYWVGNSFFSSTLVARTMCFATLGLSQLVHSYNMRSANSLFSMNPFSNRILNLSFLISASLQIGVILFAQTSMIFACVPLSLVQWAAVGLLSLSPLAVCELFKLILK